MGAHDELTPLPQGKTPYDLAMANQNTFAMDRILIARQKRFPRGIKEYLLKDVVRE
jgi:hypothetical protein